jgi:multimeric flavodoxin WrbA
MARLLIVYHSMTGGTRQMAEAAAEAARGADGAEVIVMEAPDTQPEDLLAADGYLFATPENLAAIAGVMKAFFDRCYYPVLGKIEGRPYAALICAGSDGENARKQLERIATGWRLKKIADTPIICIHAQTTEEIMAEKRIGETDLSRCRDIGATLAAGLEMGVF